MLYEVITSSITFRRAARPIVMVRGSDTITSKEDDFRQPEEAEETEYIRCRRQQDRRADRRVDVEALEQQGDGSAEETGDKEVDDHRHPDDDPQQRQLEPLV